MKTPKISIISPSFNTGEFLEETIQSIQAQSYKNFEHIVMDGASTDETIGILKKYPHVKWVSEKDRGYWEAFEKGLAIADGDYIMPCCISDGYLDKDWFKKCVEAMENDKEVSFVWGLIRDITGDGAPLDVNFKQFHHRDPPQKAEYFYYWLRTFDCWQEGNVCFRANAWRDCFPKFNVAKQDEVDPILETKFQSNRRGYLAHFVRSIASFGRQNKGKLGDREKESGVARKKLRAYITEMKEYRRDVLFRGVKHVWRDGDGHELPLRFSRFKFFMEYVFVPRSVLRSVLSAVASLTRKPMNFVMRSKHVPRWLATSIEKFKFFYQRKSW